MKPPLLFLLILIATPVAAQVPRVLNFQGRVTSGGVNFTGNGRFKFALIDAGTNTAQTATAIAVVNGGAVTEIVAFFIGSGYTDPPAVTISGDGRGATATCMVIGEGVPGYTVTNGGTDYTTATVTVAPPPPRIVHQTLWSYDGTSTAGSEPAGNIGIPVTAGLYSVALGVAGMNALPASVFDQSGVKLRVWFDDGVHGSQLLQPDQPIRAVAYALMAAGVEDNAITSAKIAPGAVQTADIAAGAVANTQIQDNAVQARHLESGAVGSSELAAGAVTSSKIASGAVTNSQLAKPPRSGTLTPQVNGVQTDFGQTWFDVTFSSAFGATPVVTLALESSSQQFAGMAPLLHSRNAAGFRCVVSGPESDVSSLAENAGKFCQAAEAGTSAIISSAVPNGGGLHFKRDHSPAFSAVLDAAPGAGLKSSVRLTGGRPGIAYTHDGDTLKFIRATNAEGTAWGAPVSITPADNLGDVTLGSVPGAVIGIEFPAVSYISTAGSSLMFIRASDTAGAAWNAPHTVMTGCDDQWMAAVAGNPAIVFTKNGQDGVFFIRATNNQGSAWGSAVLIAPNGRAPRLLMAGGVPVAAFVDGQNITFVRAEDAAGSSWLAPQTVAKSQGFVSGPDLHTVNGQPALAWLDTLTLSIHYLRALDASGVEWPVPVKVATVPGVDFFAWPAIAMSFNSPVILWGNTAAGALQTANQNNSAVPPYSVNWIAIEP